MKEIAAALVKAQRAFGPALKTKTNPHLKAKYADLSACIEAVIDALNTNGIALLQPCHESDNGVIVETLFLHESGESWSAGKLHVPASKHDAQGFGSALTYARRYSLMAACGIAPEDDDGSAASRKPIATPVPPQLLNQARDASMMGWAQLSAFIKSLSPEQRAALAPESDALKQAAKEADKVAA